MSNTKDYIEVENTMKIHMYVQCVAEYYFCNFQGVWKCGHTLVAIVNNLSSQMEQIKN